MHRYLIMSYPVLLLMSWKWANRCCRLILITCSADFSERFMLSPIRDFWHSDIEIPESIVGCVNVFRVFCRINWKTWRRKTAWWKREKSNVITISPNIIHQWEVAERVLHFDLLRSSLWQAWSKTSSALATLLFQREAFSLRAPSCLYH